MDNDLRFYITIDNFNWYAVNRYMIYFGYLFTIVSFLVSVYYGIINYSEASDYQSMIIFTIGNCMSLEGSTAYYFDRKAFVFNMKTDFPNTIPLKVVGIFTNKDKLFREINDACLYSQVPGGDDSQLLMYGSNLEGFKEAFKTLVSNNKLSQVVPI